MVKTLINYFYSRKFVRARLDLDFKLWKYLLKEALPIAFSSVIIIIYFRIDVVMLSMIQGDAPVGIYSAAYKLSEPLSLITSALMISLFPIMSASFKSSKETLIKTYRLAFTYFLIIMLPIAIGTTLIADKLILLIYGNSFANSATALQILINLLIAMDEQKLNTLSIALCAIVNVTLNFILIPVLSYNGASIATVVTNAVLFITSFYFVSKYLHVLSIHKMLIKPVISGLVMGAFVYYFIDFNMLLLIPFAAFIYILALLSLKTFSKEDVSIFKKVIGLKKEIM